MLSLPKIYPNTDPSLTLAFARLPWQYGTTAPAPFTHPLFTSFSPQSDHCPTKLQTPDTGRGGGLSMIGVFPLSQMHAVIGFSREMGTTGCVNRETYFKELFCMIVGVQGRFAVWLQRQSAGRIPSCSGEVIFCSIKTFNWLVKAHLHYGGQSFFTQRPPI